MNKNAANGSRGFTLVELVIVTAIVGILASAVLPLARWSVKRSKEHELQQNLRLLRNAIDRYRDAAAAGIIEVPEGGSGFPESLDVLLEGVPMIAEMPVPVPAVGGEYDASGPGLTGGLQRLAQQQQAAGGAGGVPGLSGADDDDGPGLGRGGRSGFGSQSSLGSQSSFGSQGNFGSQGSFGSQSGGQQGGGLQLGSSRGGMQSGGMSGMGTGMGLQRPGGASGSGTFGGGFGAFGQQAGADNQPAEPLLGPDGRPVMLVLLRRLPVDPFTGEANWGLRCYGEPPADRLWCGKDVFDIYSKSPARAIDGTYYRDW